MSAPVQQPAALPRICTADETAAIASLWNHAAKFANDYLRANGLELRADAVPGVAHIVIHRPNDAAVITLASTKGWHARPELDVGRLEQTLPDIAGQVADLANYIREADRIDRAAIDGELSTIEIRLLDEMLQIEDANPAGLRPSWREITPEDLQNMSSGVRLVRYSPQ